jgi:hypothetical protein
MSKISQVEEYVGRITIALESARSTRHCGRITTYRTKLAP